ncbi:hypothetical protein DCS_07513 [Drechmeria coniospora]|uniref:BTB domain-containing protein n=1 Tax=Drechmeria coniospora TaxID=98403 RepID=A0A151GEM7_DRECN|nr:hypothetical protein DCS_07513 [Drechmeria coniospora]KYK55550.1 hypothetical protein DCS_07513 [Drechmeria coniospora]
MPRASLDGRGRKALDSLQEERCKMMQPRKTHADNLREASPPKTNPWQRIKVVPPERDEPAAPLSGPKTPSSETEASEETVETAELGPESPTATSLRHEELRDEGPPPRGESRRGGFEPGLNLEWESALAPEKGMATVSGPISFARSLTSDGSIWNHPFGSDVVVHTNHGTYFLHRSILASNSAWFRERLPAPSSVRPTRGPMEQFARLADASLKQDGAPVEVSIQDDGPLTSHCLKFFYTGKMDACEPATDRPQDITYVPLCALHYIHAVGLQATSIAAHVTRILNRSSKSWGQHLEVFCKRHLLGPEQGWQFAFHLGNALDAAFGHPDRDALGPLRLALAGFLDAVMPLIARQPNVINLLSTPTWKRFSPEITDEIAEFRRRRGYYRWSDGVLPDEEAIGAIWRRCEDAGGIHDPLAFRMTQIRLVDGDEPSQGQAGAPLGDA